MTESRRERTAVPAAAQPAAVGRVCVTPPALRRTDGRLTRPSLYQWLAAGEVPVGVVTANPMLVGCPACGAGQRMPCTAPSRRRGGRRDVAPHVSRIEAAGAAGREAG